MMRDESKGSSKEQGSGGNEQKNEIAPASDSEVPFSIPRVAVAERKL